MPNNGSPIGEDSSRKPAIERAIVWLQWLIAPGPVLVTVIESVAGQYGHDWTAVVEAKAALGIEAAQLGPGESWSWQMPTRVKVPKDVSRKCVSFQP